MVSVDRFGHYSPVSVIYDGWPIATTYPADVRGDQTAPPGLRRALVSISKRTIPILMQPSLPVFQNTSKARSAVFVHIAPSTRLHKLQLHLRTLHSPSQQSKAQRHKHVQANSHPSPSDPSGSQPRAVLPKCLRTA